MKSHGITDRAQDKSKKVAVVGAGSWGTALAHHLVLAGFDVVLVGRESSVLEEIANERHNRQYLGDHQLAAGIGTTEELKRAVAEASLVVIAVPSSAVRSVSKQLKAILTEPILVVSTAKGVEEASMKPMSVVIGEELGEMARVAVLSGPSFAREVVQGYPTAVTIAAKEAAVAEEAASYFHYDYLRIYTSTDVVGVEFGGVLKNIIAIAAGVVDGVQFGTNARAALMTRGLAEMQRFVVVLGGEAKTVTGLSGLGDLLLTSTGDLSRNRQVGMRLGQGESLEQIVESLGQVAEGVKSAPKILELARHYGVSVPIIEEVNNLLAGKTTVKDSVNNLLNRARRKEHDEES